jgi:hypothetical protein
MLCMEVGALRTEADRLRSERDTALEERDQAKKTLKNLLTQTDEREEKKRRLSSASAYATALSSAVVSPNDAVLCRWAEGMESIAIVLKEPHRIAEHGIA